MTFLERTCLPNKVWVEWTNKIRESGRGGEGSGLVENGGTQQMFDRLVVIMTGGDQNLT